MAAKQESNYNTQQAGTVKRCHRFLPICRTKSENKVKKCRLRRVPGTRVPSVLLTGYPAPEALSSAKNPPAAGVGPGWRLSFVCSGCLFMLSWNKIRKREGTRDMKKTWHTVFLILLICLDAALLLLPLLPGYRALFDIGPHPGRPPAFRFLKLAGYALFFPLTAYGCGRLLARIRKPRLRWLPAAVFALIATALVCLHNNELHMLCQLDSGWVHVPHMYENLVRTDLTYRGGIGIFRYVLPWAGTFLLCVLAGTYSLQQFLSLCRKAFAALRRRGRCAETPTFWSWRISRRLSAVRSSGRESARFSSRTSSRTEPMSSQRRTIRQKPRRNSGTA